MRKGIVGAGNWIVDQIKTIDRWPGEGNLCNIINQEMSGGGGPCNVLFDLSAMTKDIPLYAAGKVGSDIAGDYLISEAQKRDINCQFMVRSKSLPTSFTDVMSGGGKRTFFHNRGANAQLDFTDLEQVNVDAKIFYLGYLLLLDKLDSDDLEFGTRGARLLSSMKDKGFINIVDFVSEAPEKFRKVVFAALPYIDVLVINEIEAGSTFNEEIRTKDGGLDFDMMKVVAEKFLENGVKNMVILHYPEGAFVLKRYEGITMVDSLPIEKSKIVGTNGAGDAFCAGILYGVHENLPVNEMLDIANTSAIFNLSSPSASGGAVSLEKMKEYLKNGA